MYTYLHFVHVLVPVYMCIVHPSICGIVDVQPLWLYTGGMTMWWYDLAFIPARCVYIELVLLLFTVFSYDRRGGL